MRVKVHKHHIIPRYAGGTDDPSNIEELTVEEHAERHRILFETHGHWQDEVAYKGLLKIIPKEEMSREISRAANKGNKNRLGSFPNSETRLKMRNSHIGKPNGRKGIPRDDETKLKIGEKNKGRIQTNEEKSMRCEVMKKWHKDRGGHSAASKEKMSLASKGKPKSEEHKKALRKPKRKRKCQIVL